MRVIELPEPRRNRVDEMRTPTSACRRERSRFDLMPDRRGEVLMQARRVIVAPQCPREVIECGEDGRPRPYVTLIRPLRFRRRKLVTAEELSD